MGTGLQVWSDTASSNAGSDQNINWAEGMAPSQVNDSARAEMASAAKWRDDNNATIATSGSTIAYTVTSNQISTGLVNGYTIAVQFHATNDSSATLNVDGIGPEPMQLVSGTNLSGGEFKTGSHQRFTYSSTAVAWIAFCSQAQSNIAYSQIQTVTNSRLLGNASTSASTAGGPLAEISVGSGLTFLSSGVLDGPTFYNPLVQVLTSGSGATYTTSLSAANTLPLYLLVRMVGAGGGGGAASSNSGSSATDTIFASWAAVGGSGGGHTAPSNGAGGTGGANGTGTQVIRIHGGSGIAIASFSQGGQTNFGSGAQSITSNTSGSDAVNSGAGGGGGFGSSTPGSGGGGGEYAEFIITSPSSTYTYTVGTGGTGGAAGGNPGGTGAAGKIIVEAFWQ